MTPMMQPAPQRFVKRILCGSSQVIDSWWRAAVEIYEMSRIVPSIHHPPNLQPILAIFKRLLTLAPSKHLVVLTILILLSCFGQDMTIRSPFPL